MEVDGKRVDTVSDLCEPCRKGNISAQADGCCTVCEKSMCRIFFRNHLMLNQCLNPVLEALDGDRRPVTVFQKLEDKCKKHATEIIKFYCRNHDFVGCGECFLFDHRKCEFEFIKDLAKNFEETPTFKNTLEKIERLEDLKNELEKALERNRKENGEFHDKAIDEIQKQRAEISTWLNNVTSQIEAEEMEIWNKNEIVLSKLKDWINIVGDMINKTRDEINTEKYTGENLFIRVIACNSELSDFTKRYEPEIKSSLKIKYFALEPNKKLLDLTNLENLCVTRVGNRNEELQTSHDERQSNLSDINGTVTVLSSNLTGAEAENDGAERVTVSATEDPVNAELKKELDTIQKTITSEKEKHEGLQQSYNTLKKEFEDQAVLLSREREGQEKRILLTKELEHNIVVLNKEKNSLHDLNIGLQSQVDSLKRNYETLKFQATARQEQDQRKIISLQLDLKKISENHEKECNRLSSEIRELQRQRDAEKKTYQLPEFKAENKVADEKSTGAEFTVSERAKPDKALESQFRTNVRDSKDDETMQNSIDAFKTNLESRVLMRSIELENCYITDSQERQAEFENIIDDTHRQMQENKLKTELELMKCMLSNEQRRYKLMEEQQYKKIRSLEDQIQYLEIMNYNLNIQLNKNKDLHKVGVKSPSRNEKYSSKTYSMKPEQKESRPSMVANFDEKYGKNSKGKSDKCFDNLSEVPDRLDLAAVLKSCTPSQRYSSMSAERGRLPTYESHITTMKAQPKLRSASSTEKTCQFRDPRTAGFGVGKRVALVGDESTLGVVTAVNPVGYVNVLWDLGEDLTYAAGANGLYEVKLLPEGKDSS